MRNSALLSKSQSASAGSSGATPAAPCSSMSRSSTSLPRFVGSSARSCTLQSAPRAYEATSAAPLCSFAPLQHTCGTCVAPLSDNGPRCFHGIAQFRGSAASAHAGPYRHDVILVVGGTLNVRRYPVQLCARSGLRKRASFAPPAGAGSGRARRPVPLGYSSRSPSMPPQTGEAADGRTDYNSGFKNKVRTAPRVCMRAAARRRPAAGARTQAQGFPPGGARAHARRAAAAYAEGEPGEHRERRADAAVVDGVAGQGHVPVQQG